MSRNEQNLSALTRSLLLSATIGAIPLLVVGCAPLTDGAQTVMASTQAATTATYTSEEALCARLLERQTARDAELLMRTFPDSSCIPAALAALPPNVLAAISPAAVSGLTRLVRAQIPAQTSRHLRRSEVRQTGSDGGGRSGPY